jgi:uncharacterized protein (TIGR03435 family)
MKLLISLALVISCFGLAQTKPAKLSFEVAVIRASDPNPSNPLLVGMATDPTVVQYGNMTLRDAIRGAFRMRPFQIVTPDWMASARFEIAGKLPAGSTPDQAPEMLQSLLEERFKLETRRDTKEMNVYALVVGPEGLKMKPSELKIDSKTPLAMGTDGKPRQLVSWGGSSEEVTVFAPGANFLSFVGVTSRFTSVPIVDLTGIDGLYDFTIKFTPEVSDGLMQVPPNAGIPAAASLSDAVKQFGLRIEKRKMPVEILTVTHMEKSPTEN